MISLARRDPWAPITLPGATGAGMANFSVQESISNGTLVPKCHSGDKSLLMMERWNRADAALADWAAIAKKCFDYFEGKQWSAEALARAADDDRPTITLNKIAPLVRLIIGYHTQNRLDNRALPSDDMNSTESVAEVLTKLLKHLAVRNMEKWVSSEVFLDGIVGARGYFDTRLDFEKNDFGDIKTIAKDPFTIRPDPDADTYDPEGWGHVFEGRFWSIDEVEYTFGRHVSALVEPLLRGYSYRGGIAVDMRDQLLEIAPHRTFGGRTPESNPYESYIANVTDTYRKNVLVIDQQHYVRVMQRNVVDLETGDRYPVPDSQTGEQLNKIMMWAAEQYAMKGKASPLRVENRPSRRVRWTTMIGDVIVYDSWSKYRSLTITPYFPYFRRGKTRGMVEDLLSPQDEINLRRSGQIDILTRIAHSGWMWHKASLTEDEKEKLEKFGAAAGINVEWQGSDAQKPERIQPGQMPTGIERLEEKATLDLKEIGGVNDSALGQIDRVQSGRAIESRQKQTMLGAEMYMDNNKRTYYLLGTKKVELIQDFFTEPRIYRIQGDGGAFSNLGINIPQAAGEIVNNVSVGKYVMQVDETPMSESYLTAQSEELMQMIEAGLLPVQMVQDIAVDLSTLPQKALIKARLNTFLAAQGLPTADQLVAMQQQGIPLKPSMIAPPMNGGGESSGPPGKGGEKKENPVSTGASPASPAPSPQPAGQQ